MQKSIRVHRLLQRRFGTAHGTRCRYKTRVFGFFSFIKLSFLKCFSFFGVQGVRDLDGKSPNTAVNIPCIWYMTNG